MSNKFCLVLLLMGAGCLFACSENTNNALSIKINEYVSYQEMVDAETMFFEKYSDEMKHVFPIENLDIEIDVVKYFIGGICYCPIENKEKPNHCDSETNCEYLRNRELFVEYRFDDGNIVTLIYKNMPSNRSNNFSWIESNGGNCYRYETNVNNQLSYILEDSNKNHLCGMKMLMNDNELKAYFFNTIVSNIW